MIGRALYQPGSKRVAGSIVNLDRGQLCDSTDHMATQWGWTRKKVRTFLIQLADQNMIEVGPSRGRLPSIITISNYNKYQDDGPVEGQLKASWGPVEGQLRATIEEGKEREEGKETTTAGAVVGRRVPLFGKQSDLPTDLDPDLEQIRQAWNAYAKDCGKAQVRKLTKERREQMRQIMADNGYTPADFDEAMTMAHRSDYLVEQGWFSFDWLWKSGTNLTKVLEGAYGNGRHSDLIDGMTPKEYQQIVLARAGIRQ